MSIFPPLLTRSPRFPNVIDRPRITGLAGNVAGVVFVGPAGAGKTVAAASIGAAYGRVAWARLAPAYATAADLVGLAAASLHVDASVDGSLLELAGGLLALLEAEPTVLVVDDYHLGDGDACDPLIAEVLPLVPATSLVVLCSRTRPPGLVGRAAEGLLRLVSADELAFTDDETRAVLAARGAPTDNAGELNERVGGWPAAVALVAESGDVRGEAGDALVRRVLVDDADDSERSALTALAVAPYLTAAGATAADTTEEVLRRLAARTSLVIETAGSWRLLDAARDALLPIIPDSAATRLRHAIAAALEATDPGAAIDVLLTDGDPGAAADVLGRHVSSIGVDRAVHWLYQFPPELRRQFPPVLAAGRATVDLDEAVARAEAAVTSAPHDAARREALFALGSARAHAGMLSSAATALESAVAGDTSDALASHGHTWLGIVRWWAGDVTGARVALDRAGNNALAHWASAEIALSSGDGNGAGAAAMASLSASAHPDAELSEAAGHAVMARLLQDQGDLDAALELAAAAYERAVQADGFDLAAAAPTYALLLVNAGQLDQAEAVVAQIDRRIGRHDAFAKLHVYVLRAAAAAARGDADAVDKAEASAHRIRQGGFAAVEAALRARLTPLARHREPALRVDMLGTSRVSVGGDVIPLSSWKSHKALEVLHVVALAGARGRHREEIIEAVWPDRDEDKGRVLLRAALSEIRRRLEPKRQAGEASVFLQTAGERVTVNAASDVADVKALARDGRAADALALFRGGFLDDNPYAEWTFDERRAAEALRTELAERVASDPGQPRAARADAFEVLITAEPWRESLYDQMAAMHRDAGDEAAARAAERRRDGD